MWRMTGRPGRVLAAGTAAMLLTFAGGSGGVALARSMHGGAAEEGRAGAQPSISTIAGGVSGPGVATTVNLAAFGSYPCGVSYGHGYLYIADWFMVRKVNWHSDWLTTSAGVGTLGPLMNAGPGMRAFVSSACAAVPDHSGNLVIADWHDGLVRVIAAHTGRFYGRAMTAGDIYTVAGGGRRWGNGGRATNAVLDPYGLAVDRSGNLVIADLLAQQVRVVAVRTGRFYGRAMRAGYIYAVAGKGVAGLSGDGGPATRAELNGPDGVAVDRTGNLVIADTANNRVRVVATRTGKFYGQAMTVGHVYTVAGGGPGGDGGPATKAQLYHPGGVAVDGSGNLVIADTGAGRVRVVAASTGTFYGQPMTAGDIYTVVSHGALLAPTGVAVDGAGNLAIADGSDLVVLLAASTGTFYGQQMTAGDIYTVAGGGGRDGGPATRASITSPADVVADGAGNLVIADESPGLVRVVAASTGTFYGQAMTAGDIYTIAGGGSGGVLGDGGPATKATFWGPTGVAVDSAGNLVITDTFNHRVRVVAASTGTFYGLAMTAGDIYTIAGNGKRGFSGDGGPATSAELYTPQAIAVDAAGNLVIADTLNNRVRVVAARTGTFYGQAMTAGDIYTIAGNGTAGFSGDGGPATGAELNYWQNGITVDAAGNLVITDTLNNRVRVVAARTGTFYGQAMTTGDIYTIAGNGKRGFSGDGGPATSAEVYSPRGIAVDAAGNLVIADASNYRVRVVAARTGTFYGLAMTAGDIYTIAGNGTAGFSGDGGPASKAELYTPVTIAVNGQGDLIIGDWYNRRLRLVTK